MDTDFLLQQIGLKSQGFDPGPLDGERGPKSDAAKAAWLASRSPAAATIPARMVALAQGELNVREASRNQGPGIAKYWPATSYGPDGYANREPYCAAFVSWLVKTAVEAANATVPFKLPATAGARKFIEWGGDMKGKGVLVLGEQAPVLPGDIVVFTFSHLGIAEKAAGAGADLHTIEANTDPDSSDNEGGGVYRRTRERHLVEAIIRITV